MLTPFFLNSSKAGNTSNLAKMLLIGSFMVAVSKNATAELEGEGFLEDLDLFLILDGNDLEHALSVPGSGLGIEISHSVQSVLAGDLAVLRL